MNEFEIMKKSLERVGTEFTYHDFARMKSIYIITNYGELEFEFNENGELIDTIFWRD